jgi:hypothetical protein
VTPPVSAYRAALVLSPGSRDGARPPGLEPGRPAPLRRPVGPGVRGGALDQRFLAGVRAAAHRTRQSRDQARGCLRYRRSDLEAWVAEHVETPDDLAANGAPMPVGTHCPVSMPLTHAANAQDVVVTAALALNPIDLARPFAPTFSGHERGTTQIAIASHDQARRGGAAETCRVFSRRLLRLRDDRRPDAHQPNPVSTSIVARCRCGVPISTATSDLSLSTSADSDVAARYTRPTRCVAYGCGASERLDEDGTTRRTARVGSRWRRRRTG